MNTGTGGKEGWREGGETLEEGGSKEKGSEGCNWRGKVENRKTGVIEKIEGEGRAGEVGIRKGNIGGRKKNRERKRMVEME